MFALYKVASSSGVHFNDPLHFGNFFFDKQRIHKGAMAKRQDLILYLANLHSTACRSGMPLGMIHIPMRLMSLRDWVQDYRVVLDHFFEVRQLGYNFGEGVHELSTLVPKVLSAHSDKAASKAAATLKYVVPPRPAEGTISKVYIRQHLKDKILKRLADSGRLDLVAPVEYLLSLPEHNFFFSPAGKLRQRDTSTWPVAAVETWPSWLREDLFGPGVDIDSAYTQFLFDHLQAAYIGQEKILKILYPDVIRSLNDKKNWREELCTDVLGLPINDETIGIVKKLCMSLANGSRISPAILTGGRAFSVTADLVIATATDVSLENLTRIGQRLSAIARQYADARKTICLHMLRFHPNRKNQKLVFSSYFEWERKARYEIWNECGQHGIMVHDGIDGIPEEYLVRLPEIMKNLNIKLTRT